MKVGEAASRVVVPVYHTGQGQDERAHTRPAHLLRGLDSAWSVASNPHRESATRWRAAADVGEAGRCAAPAHGWQKGRAGNRLGDSVGVHAACTGEGLRSAERAQQGVMGRGDLDSGDGLVGRVSPLRRFKGRGLIAGLVDPHAVEDAHPHIGKRSYRHPMAFSFSPLALIVGSGPRLALGRLPGELLQRIAQRFDTSQPSMRFALHATLKQHRGGSPQRLQTAGVLLALAIIADFCQPSWSQVFACTRQARKELMGLMGQKKGGNLLIILSNLREPWQQLTHQRPHQTRFRAGGHDISLQVWLMHPLDNLGGDDRRVGMPGASEDLLDLFGRSCHRCLWGGIGLQEQQGALLLQFRKQLQGHRVIRFETGRELIDQAPLHLDQGILIAREQLQLGNFLAVWRETGQIGQVRPSGLGQQVGINRIRLGTRCGSPTIAAARVDRIDGPAWFQQIRNQPPMGGLTDAGHLFFWLSSKDLLQEGVQSAHAFWRMSETQRTDLTSLFINDQAIMMG